MRKVLVLTVGGSCDPLVNAIRGRRPDFVCFVCSAGSKGSEITVDGPGKPCKGKDADKESIVSQAGLSQERYRKFTVDDPDSLEECYRCMEKVERFIYDEFGPDAEIVANYTGGTKTMSVAIAVFSLSRETWKLEFNRGQRTDLVKISYGDAPFAVSKQEVFVRQQLDTTIRTLLEKHHYAEAVEVMDGLTKETLFPDTMNRLLRLYNICRAFDFWDRFEHRMAFDLLKVYAKTEFSRDYLIPLRKIVEGYKATGYEKVWDIVLNAERRSIQGRYDDAVARLYRATEMLAQTRLKLQYNLDTSDLPLEGVPEDLREDYAKLGGDGKVKIGLDRAYRLLAGLKDPVGEFYMGNEGRIKNALLRRNSSILAHGTDPISENEYRQVKEILVGFIEMCFKVMDIVVDLRQFPGGSIVSLVWG